MKGRMPFPDPIMPVLLVAVVITTVFSTCARYFQNRAAKEPRAQIEEVTSEDRDYDPFSDEPQPDERVPSIVIKTKFVEIGSGTEELGFDWIVSPFESY